MVIQNTFFSNLSTELFESFSVLQRADEAQLRDPQLHPPSGRADLPHAALLLVRRFGIKTCTRQVTPSVMNVALGTGVSSHLGAKLRDLAHRQAQAGC